MRLSISILLFSLATAASAQTCPRLEGRFECRANPPFQLEIRNGYQNGVPVYTFSDPTASQYIVPDGAFHEMQFQNGKGSYSARCEGSRLLVEIHGPTGNVGLDKYYIERAGLVRVRIAGNQSQSLSCKPIAGTWRLYPH